MVLESTTLPFFQINSAIWKVAYHVLIWTLFSDAENISPFARHTANKTTEQLLETLQYLIDRNHDPEEHTLTKVLDILTRLRSFTEFYKIYQNNLIHDSNELGLLPSEYKIMYYSELQWQIHVLFVMFLCLRSRLLKIKQNRNNVCVFDKGPLQYVYLWRTSR